MSYGVCYRQGSDLALLWLWYKPVATGPIGPVAWEPPYATAEALKRPKKKKKKEREREKEERKEIKRCSTSQILREIQTQTTMRYELRFTGITITKN